MDNFVRYNGNLEWCITSLSSDTNSNETYEKVSFAFFFVTLRTLYVVNVSPRTCMCELRITNTRSRKRYTGQPFYFGKSMSREYLDTV